MILIADSGSTKTDWCVVEHGQLVQQIFTKGINPFFQTGEEISNDIEETLMPQLNKYSIDSVYFYGAGCAFYEKIEMVRHAIAKHINAPIEVGSDLIAAARALCGKEPGIACILGTGSNSCFYNGKEITDNVSPLGFILGDEGSGAVLGKLLVGDCLKNQLSPELKEKFMSQYQLTPAIILDKVYKEPFPNRFLASLSRFLSENIDNPEIHALVLKGFKSFLTRNVMQYDYKNNKVHFVGSVAHYYKNVLIEAAEELHLKVGTIIKSPMAGLIAYHAN